MKQRLAIAVVALLLSAACPGKTVVPTRTKVVPNDNSDDNTMPNRIREVEATVLENYRLFAGSGASYATSFSRDRPIAIAGIRPNTVLVGTWPKGIDNDRRPFQQKRVRILSKNLDVHIAKNPSVAWVSDELSYRVPYKQREASVPIRFTGVYVRDIDRWVLVMEHMSYALPVTDLISKAEAKELSILPPIASVFSSNKEVASLQRHVTSVLRQWHGPGMRVAERVAADTDVLLMWPGTDGEYRGLAASAAPKLTEFFSDGTKLVSSQYRVFVGGNLSVAWAIANHTVKLPNGHTIDLRGTYVLETRGDQGKWSVVQAHVSVPLHVEQIRRKVFGIGRH